MEVMDILSKLEDNGFEAYIVGGYVRDSILKMRTYDIDITTSAKPDDLSKLFNNNSINELGVMSIKSGDYNIEITTFRKEFNYENRHPRKIEFTKNVCEDLQRRDFTINAILMNKQGKIIDYVGGVEDINEKIIRLIGDCKKKLSEDPLRILRALRFSILLGFTIESKSFEFIKNNLYLLRTISKNRVKEELEKMFSSRAFFKDIHWLDELGVLDQIDLKLPPNLVKTSDILGFWAQIETTEYPFTKNEKKEIQNIQKIVRKACIDERSLFDYGLKSNLLASEILEINKYNVEELYKKMEIHNQSDIDVDFRELAKKFSRSTIGKIKQDLINQILNYKLSNKEEILIDYIIKNWK